MRGRLKDTSDVSKLILNQNKMKKTAMQMAIDHYKKLSEQGSNQAYVVAKFLEENFLPMEKEQIIEAHLDGQTTWDVTSKTAEQYYNETFKLE